VEVQQSLEEKRVEVQQPLEEKKAEVQQPLEENVPKKESEVIEKTSEEELKIQQEKIKILEESSEIPPRKTGEIMQEKSSEINGEIATGITLAERSWKLQSEIFSDPDLTQKSNPNLNSSDDELALEEAIALVQNTSKVPTTKNLKISVNSENFENNGVLGNKLGIKTEKLRNSSEENSSDDRLKNLIENNQILLKLKDEQINELMEERNEQEKEINRLQVYWRQIK